MDVQGLAVVAFEMLTGVRYRRLEERTEAGLRRALGGLDAGVAMLLVASLDYRPEKRPQDIRS